MKLSKAFRTFYYSYIIIFLKAKFLALYRVAEGYERLGVLRNRIGKTYTLYAFYYKTVSMEAPLGRSTVLV